ncbi:MAG: twin-arginine translocation signal domain-containing protein, partial [Planctomycetes bacterium]|nr:twin-arginine translocation signal domain-containing protein [Planctomycetota bacterium]
MREHQRIARRDFLRRSAVGALAVGLSAASARRVLGANDRINVGVIGCGGMGTGHLRRLVEMSDNGEANIKVIAVCDIYEPRKQRAKDICK